MSEKNIPIYNYKLTKEELEKQKEKERKRKKEQDIKWNHKGHFK